MLWRAIPSHPKYEVSESGQVRRRCPGKSTAVGRHLKPGSARGYFVIKLGRKNVLVHRLVCEAFNGPPPPDKTIVRHLDGTRTNNHYQNLAWGTHAENAADRDAHGRTVEPPLAARRSHTHCIRGHEFSGANTHWRPNGTRKCRKCDLERFYARRRVLEDAE